MYAPWSQGLELAHFHCWSEQITGAARIDREEMEMQMQRTDLSSECGRREWDDEVASAYIHSHV